MKNKIKLRIENKVLKTLSNRGKVKAKKWIKDVQRIINFRIRNKGITKKCHSCWDADTNNMICLYKNTKIKTLNSLCRYNLKYK